MIFAKLNDQNEVIAVATDRGGPDWQSRRDWTSIQMADAVAHGATKLTGKLHVAIDNGNCVYPRYDVIEAPAAGDKVSYSFNGDSYPDGEITSVTAHTLRVIKTSTGSTYYRRRASDTWVKKGGTWALVQGHIDERNPSF